jgi:SAM-dependent methyltransferase
VETLVQPPKSLVSPRASVIFSAMQSPPNAGGPFKPGTDFETVDTRVGYDRWSEIYDDEANPLVQIEEPLFAGLCGDLAGLDVVDLGCGTGRHTLRACRAGARVTALDFSDGMVARAGGKPGWSAVHFVRHDLNAPLPLSDASFDRALCGLVTEHIFDLPAFMAECRRILRPGGTLTASALHPAMLLRGILAHFRDPASGRDVLPRSASHEISDYVMAAGKAGFPITHLSEHRVSDAHAARNPRAAKYRDWPMLLLMQMTVPGPRCYPTA